MFRILTLFALSLVTTLTKANEFIFDGFHMKRTETVNTYLYINGIFQCAIECLASQECCVATYYTSNGTCSFSSCCFDYQGNMSEPTTIRLIKATKLVDCSDFVCGTPSNGIYEIFPDVRRAVEVYCYFGENNKSWTVIQQRLHGGVNFVRNWEDYKVGFGSPTTDYWIGNDILNKLTQRRVYKLRFDMEDFAGNTSFAEYTTFAVENETMKYRLTADGFSGNAGDSFKASNGMMFSTFDSDNDPKTSYHCAQEWQSGWWFYQCGQCNPNAPFSKVEISGYGWTMHWNKWRFVTQLKAIDMKVTPVV